MTEPWTFNGINARDGSYLLEATPAQLVKVATGQTLDPRELGELKYRHQQASESHFGVKEGVDVCDLAQTGWGVIFPAVKPGTPEEAEQQAIRDALAPLLTLRKGQATRDFEHYYKEYSGPSGYRLGESKQQFLARQGIGPGPADPDKVPYYLLIVGDPSAIPFRIQSQLGVQYAVGRICFSNVEEYAHYARSVVAAESGQQALPRRASFFGVANPDDGATQSSARHLITPLAEGLETDYASAGWSIERLEDDGARRASLAELLNGGDAPALLFTASHGMGFPKDDPLQLAHQGALLCQDWPGPKAWRGKPIPEDFYLAGDHLADDANLLGMVAFFFACYGGGTPELDEFAKQAFKDRQAIAPHPFVAALPQAMLSRPAGGALAVIGHIERAWGHSFLWAGSGEGGRAGTQITVFRSTLESLMKGTPVGAAVEYFNERYAELASDLSVQLEEAEFGAEVDEYDLAGLWTANNDARGYAIFGDPAVRLSTVAEDAGQPRRSLDDLVPAMEMAEASADARATTPAPSPSQTEAASKERPEGADKVSASAAPSAETAFGLQEVARVLTADIKLVEDGEDLNLSQAEALLERLFKQAIDRWTNLLPVEVKTWSGGAEAVDGAEEPLQAEGKALVAYSRLSPLGGIETLFVEGREPTEAQLAHHERMVAAANQRVLSMMDSMLKLFKPL